MKYLPSFVCLFASFFHSALSCATLPGEPVRPNFIFILADDLGYGELGCYGQKVIRTPRLDQMARQGLRLTRFYAGATVCAPSRSVLMTGLRLRSTWCFGPMVTEPSHYADNQVADWILN